MTPIKIARDPNSTIAQLKKVVEIHPEEVLENPILPLLSLTDPTEWVWLIYRINFILRYRSAPRWMLSLLVSGNGNGNGDGDVSGNGDGYGYGDGSGNGDGDGDGYGYGDGDGDGDGDGYGDGDGDGSGNGDGSTSQAIIGHNMKSKEKTGWSLVRDSIGNIWVGLTENSIHDKDIFFTEVYQIVRFSGTHKGLLGLVLAGPDDQCRISGGVMNMLVKDIKYAIEFTNMDAVERIKQCPWLP